jgi:hypothetical protein
MKAGWVSTQLFVCLKLFIFVHVWGIIKRLKSKELVSMQLSEIKENSQEYRDWLKTLKVGDIVVYPSGRSYRQIFKKSKIANITDTGRFRLEDGSIWYHSGKGMGGDKYRYLEAYTEAHAIAGARAEAIKYLSSVDWKNLSSEALIGIMALVHVAEEEAKK